MAERSSAGGAAAAGGMDFQHRVAAWVAAHILAEKDAAIPWDLPVDRTLEWLRCETEQPVDDLLVGTSADGLVFAQIKRTLQLSKTSNSELASALDQFVRQFIASRLKTTGPQPWDRPLDPGRDRLVLVTSPNSSEPVRVQLNVVLRRIRTLPTDQPLDLAAANSTERRVLAIVHAHVTKAWQTALGSDPSDAELRELLSFIRVQVLEMDDATDGEREAKTMLRTSVLRDPDHADTAWVQLITLCSGLAANRSGAARLDLQGALLNAGLQLKATRSFRHDIETLSEYSATTFETLAHLAEIRVGRTVIKIERQSTEVLSRVVNENSILVVGEPGSGKSGALHDLIKALKDSCRDHIFLAVDHLGGRSLAELRAEIGLEHELVQVLDNWPGVGPAFVVIDALDAARGDAAGTMIRDLIRQVVQKNGRWRVVASIRKFDLRYGEEFKNLFAGFPPSEFHDPEFRSILHFNVPILSNDELLQISSQSPDLNELLRYAPAELRDLLRVAFNLRLIAELVGGGAAINELTPITTQLELLDRYWLWRVICADGRGDAREEVLRNACENMVESRSLRVNRATVAQLGASAQLNDLLSNQVLVEWQPLPEVPPDRYVLAFSHHVLFDYAVARLLLRGTADTVVRRLMNDSDLAIVVRPSLLHHFRHVWSVDGNRFQFWNLVFRIIRADRVPEIGKLIGPSVAAELARILEDVEPLSNALDNSRSDNYTAAEQALRHFFGALLVGAPGQIPLIGPGVGPWCQILERVSRNLRPNVAYTVRSLLTTICDRPDEFTDEQQVAAGHAARRLLEFAWSQTSRDTWLVNHALQCVCRTFASDPAASAVLIRRCLEPLHLSQFGFEELPWLTREVERMIPVDAELVEEIYRAAFGHQETSEEPTPMGISRILPMISNRQQDYGMALHELGEAFPGFLEKAPERATRTLIAVMEAYVAERHPPTGGEWNDITFDLEGREARLRTDYSAIWDEGNTYRHEDAFKMVDAFQQYLEHLAQQENTVERVRALVRILISENWLAVLWRRLLVVGARYPITFGREILPLASAVAILTAFDTTTPAGEFLRAIFALLNHAERERIERAILKISEASSTDQRQDAEHDRNRLLGCLEAAAIVTNEAQRLLEEIRIANAIPPNNPQFRFEEPTWGSYGEEGFLRDQGVPVEAEVNRRIRELERPVKVFADKHLNTTPVLGEISTIFPSLQVLYEALCRADTDGVHQEQQDYAWNCLAAACARIARSDAFSCQESVGAFVKARLLETSRYTKPHYDPQFDAQFDEHPSWGSPAPRIEAAEGMIVLARIATCSTPDVLQVIERLTEDPVPSVRFQIAKNLNVLYRTSSESMWRLIELISQEDPSRGVLQGLLGGTFQQLVGAESDRIAVLTKTIFERIKEGPGSKSVREFCVGLFARLYIWRDHAMCREIVLDIVMNAAANPDEALHVLAHLREPITHGPTEPVDREADAVRERALDLLARFVRCARDGLDELNQRYLNVPFKDWPPQDQERTKYLARVIDHAGMEVYFASGAYEEKRQAETKDDPLRPHERSERFYREAGPILDDLSDAGLPSVTHHLLETLQIFIPLDPKGVFLRIGRVVRGGQKGGYQYESLAANLVVELVERYLADYRGLFREDSECRQILIEILNVFVQAGWPSARRLTYRLEEIFR
jgi:hypothetical protein